MKKLTKYQLNIYLKFLKKIGLYYSIFIDYKLLYFEILELSNYKLLLRIFDELGTYEYLNVDISNYENRFSSFYEFFYVVISNYFDDKKYIKVDSFFYFE